MQVSVGKRLKFVVEAFNRKRVMAQHTGLKAKDDMGWDIDLLNADDLQKYEERIFSEYITISDNMLTEYEKISLELSLSKKGMAQLQAMLLQLVQVRDFSLQKVRLWNRECNFVHDDLANVYRTSAGVCTLVDELTYFFSFFFPFLFLPFSPLSLF